MIFTVTTTDEINWNAKGPERVAQNVLNLIKTFQYEVAYNRTMGLSPKIYDAPANSIEILLVNEITEQIDLHEPRATVSEVSFLGFTDEGEINVKVVIEI